MVDYPFISSQHGWKLSGERLKNVTVMLLLVAESATRFFRYIVKYCCYSQILKIDFLRSSYFISGRMEIVIKSTPIWMRSLTLACLLNCSSGSPIKLVQEKLQAAQLFPLLQLLLVSTMVLMLLHIISFHRSDDESSSTFPNLGWLKQKCWAARTSPDKNVKTKKSGKMFLAEGAIVVSFNLD